MRYRRTFDCVDCGVQVTRMRATGDPLVCLDCGMDRTVQAVREMSARKGPYYERWKMSAGPRGRPRTQTTRE